MERNLRKRAPISYASPEDEDDGIHPTAYPGAGLSNRDEGDAYEDNPKRLKYDKHIAKKQSKSQAATKQFPILTLPPELRFAIYEACLQPTEKRVRIVLIRQNCQFTVRIPRGHANKLGLRLEVLRLNKQIYDEALPFLYSQTISFEDFRSVPLFLARIGPVNRALLRDVELSHPAHYHEVQLPMLFNTLAIGTNLRRLCLDGTWAEHMRRGIYVFDASSEGASAARRLYHHMAHWLESLVRAHGCVNAALHVLKVSEFRWHDMFVTDRPALIPSLDADARARIQQERAVQRKDAFYAELRRLLMDVRVPKQG